MRFEKISAVVPVYNSHETLEPLVARVKQALADRADSVEIVLVNDSSSDSSWDVIRKLARDDPAVRGYNLMRNYGQHNALLAGIRAATGEAIVTIDDDLQNPPEEAPRLLDRLDEGYDVVYGAPEHERHGLWRDLASRLTKIALRSAMGLENARRVSAFRAFRTQVRDAFAHYDNAYVSIDVLLTWGTTRFSYVTVRHEPRLAGRSNYSLRKLVTHALNMITGFSTLPLKLASFMGFAFMLFGLGVLIYVLARFFIAGNPVRGFPFLASIVSVFSGVQLFCLGVIGEYLGRMHVRSMRRPSYVLRETLDSPPSARPSATPSDDGEPS
ncbi:glycosyltransferase [Candidatus Sumerlaeota bacterium]|nr:glycosyltransferase [Candidatus Sumerlaeota bacterium]